MVCAFRVRNKQFIEKNDFMFVMNKVTFQKQTINQSDASKLSNTESNWTLLIQPNTFNKNLLSLSQIGIIIGDE
jgi:hypothetical protein